MLENLGRYQAQHGAAPTRGLASASPREMKGISSTSGLIAAGLLGTTALVTLPSAALAACLPAGGTNFICSGAETTGQIVNLNNANVGTVPGFSVDTAGTETALTITGNGNIRYIDFDRSSLSGGPNGLVVRSLGNDGAAPGSVHIDTQAEIEGTNTGMTVSNAGTGPIEVWAAGTITGGTLGVWVSTDTGNGIFLSLAGIYGGEQALVVQNNGTGDTNASVGSVSTAPGGSTGISILHGATAGNLTLDVRGGVDANALGIHAQNLGGGATDVSASGWVIGRNGPGILVENGANTTGLSIQTGDVYGESSGIAAINGGAGPTFIASTGDAIGVTGSGIGSANGNNVTRAEIQTNNTSGQIHGISVLHEGTGPLAVFSSGLASGEDEAGIYAETFGTNLIIEAHDTGGGVDGIRALNYGDGFTAITSTGTASGVERAGIFAVTGTDTEGLRIDAAQADGTVGIYAANGGTGTARVTATGHVEGVAIGIIAINGLFDPIADPFDFFAATPAGTDLTVEAASVTNGLLALNHGTGATRVSATGPVTRGLHAQNFEEATSLTVNVADVVDADFYALFAGNGGSGPTTVTASGHVEGNLYGIVAVNGLTDFGDILEGEPAGPAGTDLTVDAVSVSAGEVAVVALNYGTGATHVTASGQVNGTVLAFNMEDATDLIVSLQDVDGGLGAINTGTGTTTVRLGGTLSGGAQIAGAGTTLDVETQAVGGGLFVQNSGTGAANITANGPIASNQEFGVLAVNTAGANGLSLDVGEVSSNFVGLLAVNAGIGATRVSATGPVDGGSFGLLAFNGEVDFFSGGGENFLDITGTGGTDLSVEATTVTGGFQGLIAVNNGTGATSVTATGAVRGTGEIGLAAVNGSVTFSPTGRIDTYDVNLLATDLTVRANDAEGGRYGIHAINLGTGLTNVVSTGTVIGDFAGIRVANRSLNANGIFVEVNDVTGQTVGVELDGSAVELAVGGVVTGEVAGVQARAFEGNRIGIAITNEDAEIANLSGLSSSQAVWALDGAVVLANYGRITGTVRFDQYDDLLINEGIWSVAGGTSDFGGGADELRNGLRGTIIAAADPSRVETTRFVGLDTFINSGTFTLADGGAGDVLQTDGDIVFEAGSVYAVDLGAAVTADRIIAGGTVDLLADTTLDVTIAGGLTNGARYTVLTADGGLTGEFSTLNGLLSTAFLTIEDTYDANNAYLDVIQYRDFVDAGLTPNQIATAGALDSLPAGALVDAVGSLITDTEARDAFDQLSGELHASVAGMQLEDSRILRDAVSNRIRAAFGEITSASVPVLAYGPDGPALVPATTDAFAVWGHGFGFWGHRDGDGNAARFDRSTGGFLIGADTMVGDWRIGLLGGYGRSSFDVDDRNASGSADNYHLGLYGGTEWGALAFRTGAAYTWHDIDTSRSVAIGALAETLSAGYRAGTAQVFGDLGYRLEAGSFRFEPFVNLAYVNARTGGFTETGGAAALSVAGASTDATFTTLGLRASTSFMLAEVEATASGMVGWRHAIGDTTPLSSHAFAGSDAFTIAGAPIARNAAIIEAGLDLRLTSNASLGLAYTGQFGSGVSDQGFKASFGVKF